MTYITNSCDTIAAPATCAGHMPISIVRICGSRALNICSKFMGQKSNKTLNLKHGSARLIEIIYKESPLDRAMVLYFKKPHSFTGEDTVEIFCHGSPYIVSKIMELAISAGARPARAGEFTMRAFLNGKIDLTQAEGICNLINSQSENAHKAALSLTEGKISQKLNQIRTDLIDILARIEAHLDDPDEEIKPLASKELSKLLTPVCKVINGLMQTFNAGKFINYGIKTSIVGAPNCGKSMLLNRLLGKDRAIVSQLPGTTRDTIEDFFNLNGSRFILTDTAGIRHHALNPAEKEGMKRTHRAIDSSDIILFVTDVYSAGTAKNIKLWKDISKKAEASSKKMIKIINKCDLLKNKKTAFCDFPPCVKISCKTGIGIKKLKEKMFKTAGLKGTGSDELIITSARHYDGLKKANSQLSAALLEKNIAPELAAECIRTALKELEDIVGETTSEEVLDAVFKNFCFGK
jgi:tRNA modification GTPase